MKLQNGTYLVTLTWQHITEPQWQLRIRGESKSPRPATGKVEFIGEPDCWLVCNGRRVAIKRNDGTLAHTFSMDIARDLVLTGEWREI